MVCTALQAAIRIHCWRRNSKEVRQLLISICGIARRSELGVSRRGSLQRIVLLEKALLFTLQNLSEKNEKKGRRRKNKFFLQFSFVHKYSRLTNRISAGLVSDILTTSDGFVDCSKFIFQME